MAEDRGAPGPGPEVEKRKSPKSKGRKEFVARQSGQQFS